MAEHVVGKKAEGKIFRNTMFRKPEKGKRSGSQSGMGKFGENCVLEARRIETLDCMTI